MDRPGYCCGVCPGIVGGGYDCTCRGNHRCPNYQGEGQVNDYIPTTDEVRYKWAFEEGDLYESASEFDRWLARYRESVIDEVEDHLVRRDQFTERTLDVIAELRERK